MSSPPPWPEDLDFMIDDYGLQKVLAAIAEGCHRRSDQTATHPYVSAQWARCAKAVAQTALALDGTD
jgi:hypothetical protein